MKLFIQTANFLVSTAIMGLLYSALSDLVTSLMGREGHFLAHMIFLKPLRKNNY